MKTCPVCAANAVSDATTCFECLYSFEKMVPLDTRGLSSAGKSAKQMQGLDKSKARIEDNRIGKELSEIVDSLKEVDGGRSKEESESIGNIVDTPETESHGRHITLNTDEGIKIEISISKIR